MAHKYEWRPGYRGPAVDPNIVGREISKIERRHGECHPAMLVEAARAESSPIHKLFVWDDEKAAEAYRVYQARRVINQIRVMHVKTEAVGPAFVHVSRSDGTTRRDGYMATDTALADPALRAGVLRDALRHLEGVRHRYSSLTELAPVWKAVDEVLSDARTEVVAA